MRVWGFLRETTEDATKAGLDQTGLPRTGLNEYLAVIFPETKDWVHNKTVCKEYKIRPDYRSESLKLIVEFDGLPHYTNPETIIKDKKNQNIYEALGYKVVRIPYFIQLTNDAVTKLFGVTVSEPLFDGRYPSLGPGIHTPAFVCPAGLKRMAKDFQNFPEQYQVNLEALEQMNNPELSGIEYLKAEMQNLS